MAANPVYDVDSYHINIEMGDAAIHLLIQRTDATGAPRNPPRILSAVLIDGGHNRHAGFQNLQDTITYIVGRGYADNNGIAITQLQFDAIIITHWDADHWYGLIKLLNNDLLAQLAAGGTITTITCRYLKYDSKGPQTILYVPYWLGTPGTEQTKESGFSKRFVQLDGSEPFYQCRFEIQDNAGNSLGVQEEFLRVRLQRNRSILGTNFFTGDELSVKTTPASIKTVELLLAQPVHVKRINGEMRPGMYCVAADRKHLGSSTADVIDELNTRTNQLSIGAMIIWPGPRLSHYFAGDLSYDIERNVAKWTKVGKPTRHVTAMKASHHGSATSTPVYLIESFDPQTIILSAGNDFGHPRWELMLYLDAYFRNNMARRVDRAVWPICYPYYFYIWLPATVPPNWVASNPGKISPAAFRDSVGQHGIFQTALDDLYKRITPASGVANPYTQFVASVGGASKSAQLAWINQKVLTRWHNLSKIKSSTATVPGAAAQGAANSVATGNSTIVFNLVQCRPNDALDGQVYFKTRGDPLFPLSYSFSAALSKLASTVRPASDLMRQTLQGPRKTMELGRPSAKQNPGAVRIIQGNLSLGEDVDPDEGSDTESETDATLESKEVEKEMTGASKERTTNTTTTSTGDPLPGYTFFCKELDQGSSPTTYSLDGGDLNDFVTALHWGMVTLENTPPTTPSNTCIALLAADEWRAWFAEAVDATAFSAVATTTSITSFNVTISLPHVKSGTPSLGFDTTATTHTFDLTPPQALPPIGLLSGYDTIVFGLSPDTNAVDFTLKDLFSFAGQDLPGESLIGALDGITLTLNPGNDRGDRNAIWFVPGDNYLTVVRLEPHLGPDALGILNTFFKNHLSGLEVPTATIVAKKTMRYSTGVSGVQVITDPQLFISADARITIPPKPPSRTPTVLLFTMTLTFSPQTLDFVLQFNSGGAIEDCVNWIAGFLGLDLPFLDWVDNAVAYIDNNLALRRMEFKVGVTASGLKILACSFDAQVTLSIGGEKTNTTNSKVAIKLSYSWPFGKYGRLTGALWPSPPAPDLLPLLDPTFEPFDEFDPNPDPENTYTIAPTFNLENLYPNGDKLLSIPKQIPYQVCSAQLEIDSDGISFSGVITTPTQTTVTVPTISLNQVGLTASYQFGGSGEPTVGLSFTVQLTPPTKTTWPVALLDGLVNYTKTDAGSSWSLSASVQDLNVAAIYSFFDNDTQDAAMQMMAKIFISRLDLRYNYSSGHPSDFVFDGILLFGDLELSLTYTYNDTVKRFSASLGSDSKQTSAATLGIVLTSISDDITGLPGFVADIAIPSPNAGGLVSIDYYRSSGAIGDFVIFVATIQVDILSFTYVQFSHASWPKGTTPKRIIRVAVQALGKDISMPILGTLPQPFDEMDFVWVQDASGQAGPGVSPGFTVEEIGMINAELQLLNNPDQFRFRNINSTPKTTDVVLKEGKHFIVIMTEDNTPTVVLDYILGAAEAPSSTLTQGEKAGRHTVIKSRSMDIDVQKDASPVVPPTPPAMASAKRSFGPLTISNIGLQYKDSSLFVLLDATLTLGPIEFELLGFGLGLDLSSGISLTNFPKPAATITGLGVGFTAPPVIVAGLFEYLNQNGEQMYVGGVSVEFDPYLFLAAGGYGTITPASASAYDTVFLFAELQGPILDLEFIQVSDICGGFGYNSSVTLPTVTEVSQFPFIGSNMSGKVGNTPLDTISNITDGKWIIPQPDSLWFAVGLKAECFSVLSIDAVVVIEFNPYVTLGIFADAMASIPPADADSAHQFQDDGSDAKLAYVEMGITGVVDFQHGSMIVIAQLSPSSYILDPNCHLTGGFALAMWFGSEHHGDWVFTLGGYHQAYKRPDHYPDVPRLGINWSLDGGLTITGNSYFAITPKVCMAGGLLQAQLSLGPLGAHFDCWADFLINYKPFSFVGDVGVSVGVSFSLDLLFVTIYIDVEIGASIHLTGLPIQGYVHVDFWVFGFDVYFGPSPDPVNPCTLETFWQLLLQQSQPSPSRPLMASDAAPPPPPPSAVVAPGHTLTVESGLAPGDGSQSSGSNDDWNVRAGTFSFRVTTIFALQTITVNAQPQVGSSETQIYARPMHIPEDGTITSTMTITIAAEQEGEKTKDYGLEPLNKATPVALWGSYNPQNDPINPSNDTSDLLDGSSAPTTSQLQGLTIVAPPPTLSSDVIPAFNAIDLMSEIVSDGEFPNTTNGALPAWNPAARNPVVKDQWTDVKRAWTAAPRRASADFVGDWIKAMKWEITPESWEGLPPAPPALTLLRFNEVYMAAPCISVSA